MGMQVLVGSVVWLNSNGGLATGKKEGDVCIRILDAEGRDKTNKSEAF